MLKNINQRLLKIDKRIRFVISTLLMSFFIMTLTFFPFDKAIFLLPVLAAGCYLLTYFSILEGIEKIEWLMLFFMPVVITLSISVFYFLFPVRWLTRIPFITIYAIAFYATLLCSNIFNVGVEKSLQLYRAAFSINVLSQVIVTYFLLGIIFSFKLSFVFNIILVFVTIFCLSMQLIWTLKLELKLSRELFLFCTLIATIISELSTMLSFVPLQSNIVALFLATAFYSFSGLVLNYLSQKLFKETVREYLSVLIFVAVVCFFSLSW